MGTEQQPERPHKGTERAGSASPFGRALRSCRLERGMTQMELAEGSGLHIRTVQNLESGRSPTVRPINARMLAQALGLNAEERHTFLSHAATASPQAAASGGDQGQPAEDQLPSDSHILQRVALKWQALDGATCRAGGLALSAVIITAALALGFVSTPGRRYVCLLLAIGLLVGSVLQAPEKLKKRYSAPAAVLVAAMGVVPVLAGQGDTGAGQPATGAARVNARYLALLLEQGPFTEQLPYPLTPSGVEPGVRISETGAAARLTAVELKVDVDPEAGGVDGVFAHMESYLTEDEADERFVSSVDLLSQRYGEIGSPEWRSRDVTIQL